MKMLFFDSGPLISLTLNNLLWLIEPLKNKFKGSFCITKDVKTELVDTPLRIRRFEFEALQNIHYIDSGVLEVVDSQRIDDKTKQLCELANSCFRAKSNWMTLVHTGEVSTIAACLELGADVLVLDERTARLLIEDPLKLRNIMQHKLHTRIDAHKENLKKFRNLTKNIKLIRSSELVSIAFELGLLDRFKPNLPDGRRTLLESVLWGVKLDGCSISTREIEQLLRIEKV
ncbi:MAG TPA: hypothetical protein VJH97_00085 [Candidatus Nanoarchaeia archaeon]|nr:hypothetical protein [Candidatus Nanoarchaeia archaeon]